MRAALPAYQHFTIGESGAGVPSVAQIDEIVSQLALDKLIYVMNLNDVRPTEIPRGPGEEPSAPSLMQRIRNTRVVATFDRLATFSRVYNMLRIAARNSMIRRGLDGYGGVPAYELKPNVYQDAFLQTAQRVNELGAALADRAVEFCVVVLPYEMQISAPAERFYAEEGIEWDPTFVEGGAQSVLAVRMDPSIQLLDARRAFVRPGQEEDRETNDLGEYFITRAGGALDWNHPNRLGHRVLAEFLLRERPCSL
jgi:hypothetical protein